MRWAERASKCASHTSGSIASTKPPGPARAAALKLNKPTLAPTSQTTEPGLTSSRTMRKSMGSAVSTPHLQKRRPASGETYSGRLRNCFGRCLRKITPLLNRSTRWRRFIRIARVMAACSRRKSSAHQGENIRRPAFLVVAHG